MNITYAKLKAYAKRALLPIGFFILCFIIIFAIYRLYDISLVPARYALLLCSFFGLFALSFDLFYFLRKQHQIEQELLLREKASQEVEQNEFDFEQARRYYTLWSHQIKTPLAAMTLLLQEEPLHREALQQEVLKTSQYVDMALQYQRLQGKGHDLLLRELQLEQVVKKAIQRVAPLLIHKGLWVKASPIEGVIVSDEKWLLFALEQLLSNAAKYTNEGGVQISQPREGELLITDSGIGIRPEDLPRIWEWGFTGHNGRIDRHSTGIGLSLCKEAMDMLGHRIEIESDLSQGTRVKLYLQRRSLDLRD